MRIGSGAPLKDFQTYAMWAINKINCKSLQKDEIPIPTEETLKAFYDEQECWKKSFEIFQLLRIQLAPIVEMAIILDKVLFLEKSKKCSILHIARIFDPLQSPRNYTIIAKK